MQDQFKSLKELIKASKGKFFSITFTKKNGTERTINGKDKYFRLIKGTGSPATEALRELGYVSFVNRNKESWASAHCEAVKSFKCGTYTHTFI